METDSIKALADELGKTPAMKMLEDEYGPWKDEGDGFFSLSGKKNLLEKSIEDKRVRKKIMKTLTNNEISKHLTFEAAYIAVPVELMKNFDYGLARDVQVNGGITFEEDNVIGWDYGHAYNYGTSEDDIKTAVIFFKQMLMR